MTIKQNDGGCTVMWLVGKRVEIVFRDKTKDMGILSRVIKRKGNRRVYTLEEPENSESDIEFKAIDVLEIKPINVAFLNSIV